MSGEGDSGLVERLRERLAVWDAANYEVLTTIQVDVADVREAADEIERLTGTLVLVSEEVTIEQRARDSACREADRYREQLERLEKAATTAMVDQNNQGRVSAASRDALNDAIDNTLRALALPAVLVEERSTP